MKRIPLFKIYSTKNDIIAVNKVLERRTHWAEGPEIERFEEAISQHTKARYTVLFNSGSSALFLMLLAHGIGPGDEVVVPSFTFIATVHAIRLVGATPIFADVEEVTLGLNVESVFRHITVRTKAIILMHYGGCPALHTLTIKKLARKRNIYLFEDAAEAFGARINDRYIGTVGDAGVFSFCQNKIITSGEGGALVTNSKSIYKKLLLLRSHGRDDKEKYFVSEKNARYIQIGYNLRLSSLQAAVGYSQLKQITRIIRLRKMCSDKYTNFFKDINMINTPYRKLPKDFFPVYQLYSIRVDQKYRNRLLQYLASRGIGVKIYFPPVHKTSLYRHKPSTYKSDLYTTELLTKEILTLPLYPTLNSSEQSYIVQSIKLFFERDYGNTI